MTHDELLAKINKEIQPCGTHTHFECKSKEENQPWKALRAVMEMHKPFNADTDEPSCSRCMDATMESGKYQTMMSPYPCETIRTIEKELQ